MAGRKGSSSSASDGSSFMSDGSVGTRTVDMGARRRCKSLSFLLVGVHEA